MSALYEINQDILACIDTDTGEILYPEQLRSLQLDRSAKIRHIVCYIKNLQADARACEEEEKVFTQRKVTARKKAENLKHYLEAQLCGERIKEKEFTISWRKSQKVEVLDETRIPEQYRIPVPARIDRAGIKEELKDGQQVSGAILIDCQNIQIR
jgi:hypothetical protein